MEKVKKPLRLWVLALYFALLLGLWFVWEFFLRDFAAARGVLLSELYGGTVKLVLWTLPALLLARRFAADLLVPPRGLFRNPVCWGSVAPYALGFIAVQALSLFVHKRSFALARPELASLIGPVLFAGITEEAVFRGWLLNASLKKMGEWQAVALNAALFLLIHFPIWLHRGEFVTILSGGGFLTIAALSVVFSRVFIQSKSLIPPILLHMLWNFLIAFR